jgi:hypothetical protein
MRSKRINRLVGWAGAVVLLVAAIAAAEGALATRGAARDHSGSLTVTTVLSGSTLSHTIPGGSEPLSQPDDLAALHGVLYTVFQNHVGPDGTASPSGNLDSTVVGFTPDGTVVAQWDITGHADGLTADPDNGRLIVTVNEDAASSLYTIEPDAPSGAQVQHYAYSPDPFTLHGGGTDAVSVFKGRLLVSASSPTVANGPALYAATLSGSTASLQPVFTDQATATIANAGSSEGQSTTLALTDPDSNEVVPDQAPRFGGDFVLDSQGDQQQIYLHDLGDQPLDLQVLNLAQSINDTAWATGPRGTLYVSDNAADDVVAVRGPFDPGTPYVAVTPCSANSAPSTCTAPNYLGTLDMFTGGIATVQLPAGTTLKPAGLLFVGRSDTGGF